MTAADGGPGRRINWLKAGLVASLAVNLLFVGAGVTRFMMGEGPDRVSGLTQVQLIPRKFFGELEGARKAELLGVFRQFGPAFKDGRRAAREAVAAVAAALEVDGPRVVLHSIVWQYLPTPERWAVTAALEAAGERATPSAPLAWVRFEPDEWDRRRAAVWLRTWTGEGPSGQDRLVAHVDYHGRWISPLL